MIVKDGNAELFSKKNEGALGGDNFNFWGNGLKTSSLKS